MAAIPILVINCGSSSLKYGVYDMHDERELGAGRIERIGERDGGPPDHRSALAEVLSAVVGRHAITAVGHRVVHGGTHFLAPARMDEAALAALAKLDHLAPLHNPANRLGIALAMELLPGCPQIAVFDTAFHRDLPAMAREYAIPAPWRRQGMRRYGFHGTSHRHASREAARLLGEPIERLNLITLHLGNGSSITAVRGGVSIDTSMGMTPLEGLVMGTRAGDIDAGVLLHLLRTGVEPHELEHALNHASGLLGLCGANDMRTVHAHADAGDADAELALEIYCYRARKYIGAYMAVLGRVDALVFTAGIGENDAWIRARVLGGLECFGIELDAGRNAVHHGGAGGMIHAAASRVALLVVPDDEELEIAREVMAVLSSRATLTDGGERPAMDKIDHGANGAADAATLACIDAFWRACNYLAAGMIYLRDNPLLEEPLQPRHIKQRLLGHWGASPALSFTWAHLNRLIVAHDLNAIFLAGPGHGAPGVLAPAWLEGSYGEVYPDRGEGRDGMREFFRTFSFPGGIGSHCTPEIPGSIHEGGELGYSLSHAFGAAFDNPDLLVAVVVGDGEAETGPLATAWHGNKFLNPVRDGAVLPVLSLNGYKINNPTVLARIDDDELEMLLRGYGWTPYMVSGDEPQAMHHAMANALDSCLQEIRRIQQQARASGEALRPRWPMIVLRTPKGWTGPAQVNGKRVEGSWRAHQVPLAAVRDDPVQLQQLEQWLRSYRPRELFDADGVPLPLLRKLLPQGVRRMSANPHANGGLLRRPLRLPDIDAYAVAVTAPGRSSAGNTRPLGALLRDVLRANPDNFRIFGPDETTSNRLDAVYEASGKTWLAKLLPEDADGGNLARDGRVMEYLSEHTLEGWLEGYLLSGRHGFLSTYESFAHVIDSMFNQHAKWLATARRIPWRAPVASLNLLITSTVWRQDHNGFTHQDPGFLDVVVTKSPEVTRIYLPPDANSLLAISERSLASTDQINVIVCDKQLHLQYLDIESARRHCAQGIGIWEWASNDHDSEPDLVIAGCGDTATREALAAVALLREHFAELRIRFVNVVDLYTMTPESEHPHGLSTRDFDSLFTVDKPIIFNFHGYPWLIHRLAYRRTNHDNLHVRGYKERGSISTPLELAIENEVDRFSLAIAAIDRVPHLQARGAHAKQQLRNRRFDCLRYAHEHGIDLPEVCDWTWPGEA